MTTQFKVASGRPFISYHRKYKCFSQSLLSDDIGTEKHNDGFNIACRRRGGKKNKKTCGGPTHAEVHIS